MDEPDEPSERGRRALPLIAGALAAMVVAGLIYLHPTFPSPPKVPVAPPKTGPSLVSSAYFVLYDFVSATTGWALAVPQQPGPARSFVYRTTDGAKHWNVQLTSISANPGAAGIQFFDSKRGVVSIGSPGRLYRTSDAGTRWDSVPLPPYQVDEVTFSDPLHGWLLASEGDTRSVRHFFTTTDGGGAWTELASPTLAGSADRGSIGGLQFRRPGEGWLGAVASEPTVYATVDGGASWQPRFLPRIPQANPDLPSGSGFGYYTSNVRLLPVVGVIALVNYSEGGASKSFGYTSFDGGTTWRSVASPPGGTAWDFVFQDSSQWWSTPLGTLWKSSDAGQSWTRVSQQPQDWRYWPHIIDATHAWAELFSPSNAVMGSGLAITSDGGLHWKQVDAPQPP